MTAKTCTFQGCDKVHYGKGLCNSHWQQVRQGRSLAPLRRQVTPARRDELGRKWCKGCSEWLSEDLFYRHTGTSDRLTPECSRCICVRQAETRFKLEPGTYLAMLEAQGGVCAVCGGSGTGGKQLSVDHDHSCCAGKHGCGKCVRYLLCGNCNTGIGLFKDNPELLEAAASYLRGFQR